MTALSIGRQQVYISQCSVKWPFSFLNSPSGDNLFWKDTPNSERTIYWDISFLVCSECISHLELYPLCLSLSQHGGDIIQEKKTKKSPVKKTPSESCVKCNVQPEWTWDHDSGESNRKKIGMKWQRRETRGEGQDGWQGRGRSMIHSIFRNPAHIFAQGRVPAFECCHQCVQWTGYNVGVTFNLRVHLCKG